MRVIQLTDYGSPHAGSFVPMLGAALRMTEESGWKAHVVLPARARSREWMPDLEKSFPAAVAYAPDVGRIGLARWLRELVDGAPGPTLLHAHWTVFDIAAAALAARRRDVRTIWHFQTVVSGSLPVRIRNEMRFRVAGRFVERMLCVGPQLAADIRARGAQADKVEFFPNAVDTGRFAGKPAPDERAAARAQLGVDSSATVLLHIGRDWHLKGGDLFLDAFEALDDDSLVGLMVRGGPEAEAEIERRDLGRRVRVVAGVPDVRALHAASDVLLATSRGEGTLPWAVTEALASGLAVVATDIPGHALPGGPPPGVRSASLDGDAIATATATLLGRPDREAAHESALSHAWVAEHMGLDMWAERLRRVYRDVMASWAAR